jgi:hypothetical protein
MEDWKTAALEDWRVGKIEDCFGGLYPLFQFSCFPTFHHPTISSSDPFTFGSYIAPFPRRTTRIVRINILRSSHIDQLSMYSRSSFIH